MVSNGVVSVGKVDSTCVAVVVLTDVVSTTAVSTDVTGSSELSPLALLKHTTHVAHLNGCL